VTQSSSCGDCGKKDVLCDNLPEAPIGLERLGLTTIITILTAVDIIEWNDGDYDECGRTAASSSWRTIILMLQTTEEMM